MPSALTYPGVYVEEIPSGVRTIVGVGTSIAAFVGRAARGPVNTPIVINSFGDFERQFGGIWKDSTLGYAVRDFYLNGGSQAVIVRLFNSAYKSEQELSDLAAATDLAIKTGTEAATPKAAAEAIVGALSGATDKVVESIRKAMQSALDAKGADVATVLEAAKSARQDALAALDREKALSSARELAVQTAKEITDAATKAAEAKEATAADVGKAVAATKPSSKDPIAHAVEEQLKKAAAKAAVVPGATAADLLNVVKKSDQIVGAVVFAQAPASIAGLDVNGLALQARNEGAWGNALRGRIDHKTLKVGESDPSKFFNLTIQDTNTKVTEVFSNVTLLTGPRNVAGVLEARSELVRVKAGAKLPKGRPEKHEDGGDSWDDAHSSKVNEIASDGEILTRSDYTGPGMEGHKTGLFALLDADQFNILCLPPFSHGGSIPDSLIDEAIALCEKRRAMLLIDPPAEWATKNAVTKAMNAQTAPIGAVHRNAALFFPRVLQADPLLDEQIGEFVPCGIVAGIFARTDATRGVWKAPAGFDASLRGVSQLSVALNDSENGELNKLGINCLRSMPAAGKVVWGARTREGDDRLASEWKYIPVRRTALYIEESLYRGTHWVVFEPNDEPLWGQIRLNVGAFMNDLYRKGAFQGQTPGAAYFVKCDKETNPQNDIDKGIVNIHVGFAPLKPAEFVVIKLQQIAGQILT